MGSRHTGVDAWKTVAVLTVVFLHATITFAAHGEETLMLWAVQPLCQWAVPFFFVAAGYFQGSRLHNARWSERIDYARVRVVRLVPPYILWSLAYVVIGTGRSLSAGAGIPQWNPASLVLLGGADPILWYLPAVLYAGLLACVTNARMLIPLAVIADAMFLLIDQPLTNNIFVSRFPLAIALTLFGFNLWTVDASAARKSLPYATGLLLMGGIAGALLFTLGDLDATTAGLLSYVRIRFPWFAGALFFMAALSAAPTRGSGRIARLAPAVFGVYLTHQIVLYGVESVLKPSQTPAVVWILIAFSAATTVSFLGVRYMSRLTGLRRFIT